MKWPPYLLKVSFGNPEHAVGFWLPLFLIWPVVLAFFLAVFLILLPFALLSIIFSGELGWLYYLLNGTQAVYRLFSQLPGLIVNVEGNRGGIYLEFV